MKLSRRLRDLRDGLIIAASAIRWAISELADERARQREESMPLPHADSERQARAAREAGPWPKKKNDLN